MPPRSTNPSAAETGGPATQAPTVAVVIPSFRRLERLPPLIRAYLDQGADEVVIVLDGAHPGWESVVAGDVGPPRVKIVETDDRRGLAAARLTGLLSSESAVVLMADDDVEPVQRLIDRHRSFHAVHDRAALLGYMPVALPSRRGVDQAPTYLYARDYENQVSDWERASSPSLLFRSFWTGNASVSREFLLAAEDFLPTATALNYNEDLDLGLRLEAVGGTIAFDHRARADHRHDRGIEAFRVECVRRGVAVADLEARWSRVPDQLAQLIEVPGSHHALVRAVVMSIAHRRRPGVLERALLVAYRVAGRLRLFEAQDAISRLLRRALAIRGYRGRRAELDRGSTA